MISNLSKKITTTTITNNIDGDHNKTNNKSNNDDEWNNHHDGQWLAIIVMEWAPANKWHWFISYSLINPWSTAAQQAKIVNNQRRTSISTITWPTPVIVKLDMTPLMLLVYVSLLKWVIHIIWQREWTNDKLDLMMIWKILINGWQNLITSSMLKIWPISHGTINAKKEEDVV